MDGPESRQLRQDVLAAEDATMTTTAKRKIRKASDTDRGPKDPAEYGIAWAKTLYTASLLLAELLLLAFRLLICSLESLYNLLLPPVEKSLANEIVLVTGTGHGIGRELCFQFAPHGCTVVCCDIDEKGNEETVRLLAKLGYTKNIHAYTCDVSNRAAVLAMAEKVRQEVGDVTVLVNNAGIMPCHPLSGHKPQEIEKIFDVNVLAHFWTLEAFLPSMVAKNHGHVVALSSMCGVMGIPNVVPYCASKFAVRGLMEALYEEMRASDNTTRKSQIKFTTVYPIMVGTGLVKRPRNRFPALLALLPPDRVASMIVKAMRRNYKELSLPPPMLFVDRVSRLLPSKFIQHCKDFLDTGVDPVD
ncbi:estradiol 17-beta-dehydrogenase 11-like isoform X1 [Macrosteles quadrilineatus]|uniref:estradiol 17-beta-dehydrogenase 11-like isoform X1 n=2 Tax=Macrosteles quadrilineatus TaxID=74068 RepID=UPI0023E2CAC9|nr:estradiol 17-beta-dehydrogenase 11-like isoform X1 [Macrosteles quadrilineatus]